MIIGGVFSFFSQDRSRDADRGKEGGMSARERLREERLIEEERRRKNGEDDDSLTREDDDRRFRDDRRDRRSPPIRSMDRGYVIEFLVVKEVTQ